MNGVIAILHTIKSLQSYEFLSSFKRVLISKNISLRHVTIVPKHLYRDNARFDKTI